MQSYTLNVRGPPLDVEARSIVWAIKRLGVAYDLPHSANFRTYFNDEALENVVCERDVRVHRWLMLISART